MSVWSKVGRQLYIARWEYREAAPGHESPPHARLGWSASLNNSGRYRRDWTVVPAFRRFLSASRACVSLTLCATSRQQAKLVFK